METIGVWFRGLRLKMLALVLLPSIIIGVLVYLTGVYMKDVNKSAEQVTEVRVPSLQGLQYMDQARSNMRLTYFNALSDSSILTPQEVKAQVDTLLSKYHDGWAIYEPLEQTTEEAREWQAFVPEAKNWEDNVLKVISSLQAGNRDEAKNIFNGPLGQAFKKSQESLSKIFDINYAVVVNEKIAFKEIITKATNSSYIFGLIGIVSTLIFGLYLAIVLTNSLTSVTDNIAQASSQVAAASEQLSRSSESLSSASQEQASSIEETSASLIEIMGMTESNVKNAESSNRTANTVNSMSEETRQFMEQLALAMKGILDSNIRIEKLVKVIEEIGEKTEVIDDIVFKTQLLSFNASVEAERAGEHGRGFAVVAQEVGNLAQLSGRAATDIAGIVKASIKEAQGVAQDNKIKVEKGEELAIETKNKMVEVLRQTAEILDGTSRIVTASKEQSSGINQINISVESLNKATQETASTAEESSSASQELASQAATMMDLVSQIRKLISGTDTSVHEQYNNPPLQRNAAGAHKSNVISISKSNKWSSSRQGASSRHGTAMKLASGDSDTPSHDDSAWEKI